MMILVEAGVSRGVQFGTGVLDVVSQPIISFPYIIASGLIAASYIVIAILIWRFIRCRDDLQRWAQIISLIAVALIAICGVMHIAGFVGLRVPIYAIDGWLIVETALVSVATAAALIVLLPRAMKTPSMQAIEMKMETGRATLAALDAACAPLAANADRSETELRNAEPDQRWSTTLLNTLIEVVPGLIYAKDRSGRILLANRATLELIGKQWSEVEGRRDSDFLKDPRQAEKVMANDRSVMEAGSSQVMEEIIDHPNHGKRIFLSTKVPFGKTDIGEGGLVGVSIDVTERKRLEKELVEASRRAAMGEIGTAIAHEINQPLAAISFYLDGSMGILAREGHQGPLIKSLEVARDQCLRAGEIIRRLRSFAAGVDIVRRLENITLVVDHACEMALLGSPAGSATISISHDQPDIPVLVDRIQIEQVIVNLVRNSVDATHGAETAALCVTTGLCANNMAMVSISDSGSGIDADVASRLFEPFVSTKGTKGMGVGLSICRTIIESHGGKIWFEPAPLIGAQFHFTLPTDIPS